MADEGLRSETDQGGRYPLAVPSPAMLEQQERGKRSLARFHVTTFLFTPGTVCFVLAAIGAVVVPAAGPKPGLYLGQT